MYMIDKVYNAMNRIINQFVWMTNYKMHGGIIRIFKIKGCHGDGSLF